MNLLPLRQQILPCHLLPLNAKRDILFLNIEMLSDSKGVIRLPMEFNFNSIIVSMILYDITYSNFILFDVLRDKCQFNNKLDVL